VEYPANGSTFRFGVFNFDPQTCVLRKNGRLLKLQPQPAKVLALLVARPNQLVSRQELRERIFGNDLYGDFEHALNVCISQLRAVLDDDAESPRYIETVPRSGYLFVAPVEEIELAGVSTTKQLAPTGQSPVASGESALSAQVSPAARSKRKLLVWGVGALAVAGCCLAAGYLLGKRRTAVVSPPSFTRLTYDRGIIYSARFAPDGQVVYDASWDNKPIRIFTTHAGILQPMPLDLASAHLLGISATGELALALNGYAEAYPVFLRGTLARAPMAGGAPRQLLEDVRWADFDSKGELAVVHHSNGRSRLEYPVGKVLHETAGWISHIRFSPKNDRIAFIDHPIWADDRGSIAVVDLEGKKRILSTGWESAMGLAWSPNGNEIWFTAAKSGERRDLLAVDLHARQRTLLQIPGGITVHDISPDGRVLLTVENERIGTMALTPAGERDLSWLDITFPVAISDDGKKVLLEEQSEQAGSDYWIGFRGIDGSPPVRLGEGWGGGFSPDGKWTATDVNSIPESTFLLPIGTGERRELKHSGIKTYAFSVWFMPDGKNVVFAGIESGHSPRSYVQSLQGGPARPITPEGLLGRFPSPNGRYLVGQTQDQSHVIYDIQRGESRALSGTTWQLWPAGWSPDSRFLYLYTRAGPPSQIWRFDMATGQQKLVRQLSPTDPAGILEIFHVQMTPDEKTFVYACDRYLSELYIVDGLH
jgi:DNA-binding winged helix-turn-helix (wHTH) protein/WD40 repeat protein